MKSQFDYYNWNCKLSNYTLDLLKNGFFSKELDVQKCKAHMDELEKTFHENAKDIKKYQEILEKYNSYEDREKLEQLYLIHEKLKNDGHLLKLFVLNNDIIQEYIHNNITSPNNLYILDYLLNKNANYKTVVCLSNITKEKDKMCVYASRVVIPRNSVIEVGIEKRINILNFMKLNVLWVLNPFYSGDVSIPKNIWIENTPDKINGIEKLEVNQFFSPEVINKLIKYLETSNTAILVLDGISYDLFKLYFKLMGVTVKSGKNNLKGFLAPNAHKLSKVLMLLYGFNNKYVTDSFKLINSSKEFSISNHYTKNVDKFSLSDINQYFEFLNYIIQTLRYKNLEARAENKDSQNKSTNISQQKREYHTSVDRTAIENSGYSSYFNELDCILKDLSKTDEEKQKLIENSLIHYTEELIKDDQKFIGKYQGMLRQWDNDSVKKVISCAVETYILHKTKAKYLKDLLPETEKDGYIFIIITYSIILTYYNKIGYTSIAKMVGYNILKKLYIDENKKSERSNIADFIKSKNLDSVKIIKLGDYFIALLTQLPHNIFDRDYEMSTISNKEVAKLTINHEYLESIKNNLIISPTKLPMICKPAEWSDHKYGGYLINDDFKENIITKSINNKHKTLNLTSLYKAVNILSSTEFKINKILLDYLLNEGEYILNNVKSEDKLQRLITLKLAKCFYNTPFYLTVHADWRGRLYTESFFLSYQGSDLSLALINLSVCESLSEDGLYYLYIYGANLHNEKELSKKSYDTRIQWVKDNYQKIINLDKDLILSSENPFMFTSFCLNLKEINKDRNFKVSLPIFLDATCSGMQHFAALLKDVDLGQQVNLVKSTKNDIPSDIYTSLLKPINNSINKYGENNIEYSHFKYLKFTRKIVKQSIMTKVYNVTNYGIAEQLKNKLDKVIKTTVQDLVQDLEQNLKYNPKWSVYLAPGIHNKIELSKKDLFKIAEIINNEIFIAYPSLNEIYSYFIKMTELFNKLGIPMSWITPNGLQITQHYLKIKKRPIAINLFKERRKIVLQEITDKMDVNSQAQAIIPNVIHSLDATHLINVVLLSKKLNYFPILTIHDCFGTHPNKMGVLANRVKTEFAILYTNNDFLADFHNHMISLIKLNNFDIKDIDSVSSVYATNIDEWLVIPKVPKTGKLDLKNLDESSYMIT